MSAANPPPIAAPEPAVARPPGVREHRCACPASMALAQAQCIAGQLQTAIAQRLPEVKASAARPENSVRARPSK